MPSLEETPIQVLEKQVIFYKKFIDKIRKRDGIHNNEGTVELFEKKMIALENSLQIKIKEFNNAIQLLRNQNQSHDPQDTNLEDQRG